MYRHILAAVETHDEGQPVLARARDLARLFGARLSVVHVVEYLPVDPAGDALLTTPVDLSRERATQAATSAVQTPTNTASMAMLVRPSIQHSNAARRHGAKDNAPKRRQRAGFTCARYRSSLRMCRTTAAGTSSSCGK